MDPQEKLIFPQKKGLHCGSMTENQNFIHKKGCHELRVARVFVDLAVGGATNARSKKTRAPLNDAE